MEHKEGENRQGSHEEGNDIVEEIVQKADKGGGML